MRSFASIPDMESSKEIFSKEHDECISYAASLLGVLNIDSSKKESFLNALKTDNLLLCKKKIATVVDLVALSLFNEKDLMQLETLNFKNHGHLILKVLDIWRDRYQSDVKRIHIDILLAYPVKPSDYGNNNFLEAFFTELLDNFSEKPADITIELGELRYFSRFMQKHFKHISPPVKGQAPLYPVLPVKKKNNFRTIPVLRYRPERRYFALQKPTVLPSKENALALLCTELGGILLNPAKACYYLKPLNRAIKAFSADEGRLPSGSLNESSFVWQSCGSFHYPVPNNTFEHVKQNSLLKNTILLFLQRHGIGNVHMKLFGYVDPNVMAPLIQNGVYFSDAVRGGHVSLCHGKITHMIQIVLIALLIDARALPLDYKSEECDEQLTITDVLNRMTQPVSTNDKRILWDVLLDNPGLSGEFFFSSPFHLNSFLMMYGEFYKLTELRAAMILSFLKHFEQCKHTYNIVFNQKMTNDDFWQLTLLTPLTGVFGFDIPLKENEPKREYYYSGQVDDPEDEYKPIKYALERKPVVRKPHASLEFLSRSGPK